MTEPDKTTTYEYDAAGNRKRSMKELIVDTSGADVVEYTKKETSYTYSASNELTGLVEQRYSGTTFAGGTAVQYSYDPNGNQYMTLSAKLSEETAEAELGLVVGTAVGVEMTQAQFDVFGRMTSMTKTKDLETVTATYTYNGDGLRQSRTVTSESDTKTTNYLYDGSYVVQESGSATATYVRGMNYIAKIGASNSVSYYQYNAHGDVVGTTDSVGAAQNRYDYSAFGEEKETEETAENSLRYGGEFYDAELELYYQRARYYEPSTGRFLSEDTYTGAADNPATFNLYAFCNGDPVNYIDPRGHAASKSGLDGTEYFLINPSYTSEETIKNQESAFHARGVLGMDAVNNYIFSTGGTLAIKDSSTGKTVRMDGQSVLYNAKSGEPHSFPNTVIDFSTGMIKGNYVGTWMGKDANVSAVSVITGETVEMTAAEYWKNRDRYVRTEHKTYIYSHVDGARFLIYGWEIQGNFDWADTAKKWNLEHPGQQPRLDYVNDGDNEIYLLFYIIGETNVDFQVEVMLKDGADNFVFDKNGHYILNDIGEAMTDLIAEWDKAGVKVIAILCPGNATNYPNDNYVLTLAKKIIEKAPNAQFMLSTADVEPTNTQEYNDRMAEFYEFMGRILSNNMFDSNLREHFAGIYFNHETYANGQGYMDEEPTLNEVLHMAYTVSDYVHGTLSKEIGRLVELIWAPCVPIICPKTIKTDVNTGEAVFVDGVETPYIDAYLVNWQYHINHGEVGIDGEKYPLFDRVFIQPTLYFQEEIIQRYFNTYLKVMNDPKTYGNLPITYDTYMDLNNTLWRTRESIMLNMDRTINSVQSGVVRFANNYDTNTSGVKVAVDIEMDSKVVWADEPYRSDLQGWSKQYTDRWGTGNMMYLGYTSEIVGMDRGKVPTDADKREFIEYINLNVFGLLP